MSDHDWTTPGTYPVAPDVHRIPLALPDDGLRAVNVYAVEGEDGITCIDGGWALEASRRQLESALREIGYHPRDITSFLVTHAHRDHYTQAIALRREFRSSRITLGRGEEPAVRWMACGRRGDRIADRLEMSGARDLASTWRAQTTEHPEALVRGYPDEWLAGDTTVTAGRRRLDAIATPGHTAGHYVFADLADGKLFAGDHVLPTITPTLGFEAMPNSRALSDFLTSLAKIRRLPDMVLLPAHGDVGMSSHARIDELLEHHRVRLAQCLAGVDHGAETAAEVAAHLRWTRHQRRLEDLDRYNTSLAVLETLVHLDLLVATGELERHEDGDGVYRHRPPAAIAS